MGITSTAQIDRVFQVLITDDREGESRFSEDLQRNIQSLKSLYPNASYTRYDDASILEFLDKNFEADVVETYRLLTPFAFKADLARYCLLHHYGGLYSDLSYLHLRPIAPPKDSKLIVFRDIAGHPSWSTSNSIIWSKPGQPALERAIRKVVAHGQDKYYGLHPLDPTGPYMFGRALAEGDDWSNCVFGDSSLLSRDDTGRANIVKILPENQIVAIRNKTVNCSISDLVDGQSNHYGRLWKARKVWGEKSLVDKLSAKLR